MRPQTWRDACETHAPYLCVADRPITREYDSPWRVICPLKTTPPTTRRLRWPIGRRGPSVLGWVVTSSQCRHDLAEDRAEALDRPPIARNMRRAFMGQFELMRIVLGVKYNGNPRQGWAPSGEALTLSSR